MDVARCIRDLMTDRDIKNRTIARELGLKESTLSGYLRGERTTPYDVLVQIADYLNVSTDYLLGRTDIPDVPLRLSDSERRLILDLRTLRPDQKAVAAQTVRFMAEQNRR
jgi:transcriptional regulator with XRE-family HTH domain